MTRAQLLLVSALSALATVAVLAGGAVSSGPSAGVLETAAKRTAYTVKAPAASAAPATTPATADTTDTAAAADPGATADTAPVTDATTDPTPQGTTPTTTTPTTPATTTPAADDTPPRTQINHVFQIVLAGHGFDAAFGPASQAPYLSGQLRPQGTLLTGYRTLGAADLPDHLALIGGQPPNPSTRADCPAFKEIPPATKPDKDGVISADGCVYPNTILTIGDQLTASGRTWRAYVEDLDKGTPPKSACRRPNSNAADDTLRGRPGDSYATRHNPFVYYHSLLDLSDCDANDGPLERLDADLQDPKKAPAYAYVVPNLCHDGTEDPCADGSPGGLPAADAFLATWVPKILASKAFADGGLLIVTFAGDVAAQQAGTAPETPVRQGALLVSRWAQAGGTDETVYDPYALLRSTQDLLGLKSLARSKAAASFAGTTLAGARLAKPGDD